MGLIDKISIKRIHIEEKISGHFSSISLRGQWFITPSCFYQAIFGSTKTRNLETEMESWNHGITETEMETEYGIRERRFQVIKLKKQQ